MIKKSAPIILLIVLLATNLYKPPARADAVSNARMARLAHGINLPFWFWYGPVGTEGIRSRFAPAEFTRLRQMGFTDVRIPITMPFFYDPARPGVPSHDMVNLLQEGIDQLIAADLAVIVDLHTVNIDEGAAVFSGDLETSDAFVTNFLAFWSGLAATLSSRYSPEMLFFEIFNEPVFYDNQSRWNSNILPRAIAAVRAAAPNNTIIASGARWASMDSLMLVTPVADTNVIYNFHFYEPMTFTHQGATWVGDPVIESLYNVPYPSTPNNIYTPQYYTFSAAAQAALRTYGSEQWNIQRIDARIAQVVAWANAHNVRLIATEFGAYAPYAPRASRIQWISDTRRTFEKYGIAWTMWEYDSDFGFATRNGSQITYDSDVITALGLQP
ncbi:MAG: cellulase family glycosylhydrolase [Chloroflexi bacterium]|nr:cellulase family glycosylhydrolase [Chloroflexota bacterium]